MYGGVVRGFLLNATQGCGSAWVVAAVLVAGGIASYIFLLGRVEPLAT